MRRAVQQREVTRLGRAHTKVTCQPPEGTRSQGENGEPRDARKCRSDQRPDRSLGEPASFLRAKSPRIDSIDRGVNGMGFGRRSRCGVCATSPLVFRTASSASSLRQTQPRSPSLSPDISTSPLAINNTVPTFAPTVPPLPAGPPCPAPETSKTAPRAPRRRRAEDLEVCLPFV